MISGLLLLAQLAVVARAPSSVASCDAVELTVVVSARGTDLPALAIPSLAPFDVLSATSSPHVTRIAADGGSLIAEYRFMLTTERAGLAVIPPFVARASGVEARSAPVRIAVRATRNALPLPTVIARARIDTSAGVDFRAPAAADTVFVGQQTDYEVAVFLNGPVRDRLARSPTFFPPDMQGMLAYELPALPAAARTRAGSRCFDALVYRRALFALTPGRFAIAPAELSYALRLDPSFFSREESHDLRTDSSTLVAIAPPAEGRPEDWNGAVGRFAIDTRVDSTRARVGDPMLLTVRLTGTGNVKLLPAPAFDIPWASLVRGDERVSVDTTARRVRGAKEFDWVLTPRIAGELDVPPIRYSYFDPETRRYATTAAPPLRVAVAPGALVAVDSAAASPPFTIREQLGESASPPPYRHPIFWLALAAAPLPALLVGLRRRRRHRVVARTPLAQLRLLAREGRGARDAASVRRLYAEALGARLGLAPHTMTRPGALARALRRAGVSADVATRAEALLAALEQAAFAPAVPLPEDAAQRAVDIATRVDEEALARERIRVPRELLVVMSLLIPLGASVRAQTLPATFARGVAEYRARRFAAAARDFAEVVRREPRSPGAWANYGTASWQSGDTASAVAGWQHALRLDPGADDARDRLAATQPAAIAGIAWIPPAGVATLLWSALGAWLVAWTAALVARLRRGRRGAVAPRRIAMALGALAVALLVAGAQVDQLLAARALVVVRRAASLHADAALGAETTGRIETGEVARVLRREGAWSRVTLDGGREGWLESDALRSLERGTAEF